MQNAERNSEIVVGIHSIAAAIRNPVRHHNTLYATEKSLDELKKRGGVKGDQLAKLTIKIMPPQKLQELGKRFFEKSGFTYQRIASHLFLLTSPTPIYEPAWVLEKAKRDQEIRILCLDNVTDIQNIAAVMRTMAFFNANILVISQKKIGVNITPSASRIASGALEFVNIVACSNLSRLIGQLEESGVTCIGFSEHSKESSRNNSDNKKLCLVMGAEDVGLSHAVERRLENLIALKPKGPIQSLNVSVASALAMQMFFSG